MWFGFFFFHNLLKFDIVNADVPVCKRGHNLETKTEAKLNKARNPFSKEVSLNVDADFSKFRCKTHVNELKMFTLIWWLGVKIPSALTDVGTSQFTTTMAYDNLK